MTVGDLAPDTNHQHQRARTPTSFHPASSSSSHHYNQSAPQYTNSINSSSSGPLLTSVVAAYDGTLKAVNNNADYQTTTTTKQLLLSANDEREKRKRQQQNDDSVRGTNSNTNTNTTLLQFEPSPNSRQTVFSPLQNVETRRNNNNNIADDTRTAGDAPNSQQQNDDTHNEANYSSSQITAAVTASSSSALDWPPRRATTANNNSNKRSLHAHEAFERQRTQRSPLSPPPAIIGDISGRSVVPPADSVLEATRRSRSKTPPPQLHRHLLDDDKARREYHLTPSGTRSKAEDEISRAIDQVFIQLAEFDTPQPAEVDEDLYKKLKPKKVPLCEPKPAFEDSHYRYTPPATTTMYNNNSNNFNNFNGGIRQPYHQQQQQYFQLINNHNNNNGNYRPDSSIGSSGITEGGSMSSSGNSGSQYQQQQQQQHRVKPIDFTGFDLNSEYHIGLGGSSGFGGGDFRLIDDIYERARQKRLTMDNDNNNNNDNTRRRYMPLANAVPIRSSPIPDNRYDSAFEDSYRNTSAAAGGGVKRTGSFRRARSMENGASEKLRTARALYDFRPSNAKELALRENDTIIVYDQLDRNWCEGECNGRVGIFPINYVEFIRAGRQRTSNSQSDYVNNNNNSNANSRAQSPAYSVGGSGSRGGHESYRNNYGGSSPQLVNKYDDVDIHLGNSTHSTELGQARAIFDFRGQNSFEMSCKKGELLILVRRVDQNWYEARVPNTQRRGIVPANYIQIQRVITTSNNKNDNIKFENNNYNTAAMLASVMTPSMTKSAPAPFTAQQNTFTSKAAAGDGTGRYTDDNNNATSSSLQQQLERHRLHQTTPPTAQTIATNNNRPLHSNGGITSAHRKYDDDEPVLMLRRPSFRRESSTTAGPVSVDAYGNAVSRNDPGADRYIHGNNVIDELCGKLKSQKSLIDNIVHHPTTPTTPTASAAGGGGVGALIRSQSRQSVDGGDRRGVAFEHVLAPSAAVAASSGPASPSAMLLMNGGDDHRPPLSPTGSSGGYAQYRRHRHDSDASPEVSRFISQPDSTPQRDRTSQHYTPDKLLQMQQLQEQKGEPQPYRVLYSYAPQNEDELELREGDRVYVFEKCDDNWYVGTTARGEFGVFPGNYVTPMF